MVIGNTDCTEQVCTICASCNQAHCTTAADNRQIGSKGRSFTPLCELFVVIVSAPACNPGPMIPSRVSRWAEELRAVTATMQVQYSSVGAVHQVEGVSSALPIPPVAG